MPPSASIPLALLFVGLFQLLLPTDAAWALTVGFLGGYLGYDMTHYYVHHRRPKGPIGRRLRELHMRHHFQDHTRGYGVSAPWWDRVFGTSPRPGTAAWQDGATVDGAPDRSRPPTADRSHRSPDLHRAFRVRAEPQGMPNLRPRQPGRSAARPTGKVARPRRARAAAGPAEWSAVRERRRLRVLGTGVGRVGDARPDRLLLVRVRLPAGWRGGAAAADLARRRAGREPSRAPAPRPAAGPSLVALGRDLVDPRHELGVRALDAVEVELRHVDEPHVVDRDDRRVALGLRQQALLAEGVAGPEGRELLAVALDARGALVDDREVLRVVALADDDRARPRRSPR